MAWMGVPAALSNRLWARLRARNAVSSFMVFSKSARCSSLKGCTYLTIITSSGRGEYATQSGLTLMRYCISIVSKNFWSGTYVRVGMPRRALHASCESPWHSLAKPCILDTCFLLTGPFRGMLLTPQGGPRCLAPTAHQIPVYLMVFSTFLCRAFTAHYLYTPRYCYISPLCFTAQRRLEVYDPLIHNGKWSRPPH